MQIPHLQIDAALNPADDTLLVGAIPFLRFESDFCQFGGAAIFNGDTSVPFCFSLNFFQMKLNPHTSVGRQRVEVTLYC